MLPKLLPRHHGLEGTLKYLFAPIGEHTDPHLVAAWDTSLLEFDDTVRPGTVERRELVRQLDAPRRLRGKHVKAGHVLHVPISVHAEDGLLGDTVWRGLAEEFVAWLGLDRCRWVAVHHGTSRNDNDHIHLVVQLVGEDGRVARLDHSKRKARAWALEVEQRLNLVHTGRSGTGARELTRAEYERAHRDHKEPEPQRRVLERKVRAAAAGATDPGEFVDNLTRAGVEIDLVTAEVGPDGLMPAGRRVVGYTVALTREELARDKVPADVPALRLSGGQLARDLALGEVIDRWRAARPPLGPDGERTPTRESALVGALTAPGQWRAQPADGPLPRWRRRMTEQGVHEALDTLDALVDEGLVAPPASAAAPSDRAARLHHALDQAAGLATVVAVLWPAGGVDEQGRPVGEHARRAAEDLAAAARLTRPAPTRRPVRRPDPLLPELASAARVVARTAGDPELTLLLLILIVLAVLVIAVSAWFDASAPRGTPDAHVHDATTLLRPYEADAHELRTPRDPPARTGPDLERRPAPERHAVEDGHRRLASILPRLRQRPPTHTKPHQPLPGGQTR
ncbi:hypothetical protein ALI22I_28430 [Saccharothrix sp. ALI-22-I]|uniref:relaxase/mobilization nuclease domain-containing protein n=1 Tax=Saccharothrix sp. ALI-22-I TaxID=1933778 RepID=UPI00097BBA9A|nr:relaxase/mobilization nuclease domain-containing protein [Saccharothrix sp. ALI-22-I]ONI85693.1 hypothetical protein ALI22I_28430 [Saccharothrix sp. ALI-22-I]